MIPWYNRNPSTIPLDEANDILKDKDARKFFPNQFNNLIASINVRIQELKEKSKQSNPLAWFQPSYEQNLKLTSWVYGINYLVDFDANRIGKTCGTVINAEQWILPNDSEWLMFKEFTDHLGRTYKNLPRPTIHTIKQIQQVLSQNNLSGNPLKPITDTQNQDCFLAIRHLLNPEKQIPNSTRRIIWQGAPDNDYQKEIIMPEWKKWLPTNVIERYSEYDLTIDLKFPTPPPKHTVSPNSTILIIFKSYDSKDTKWSGAAVDGILLTEGIPRDVFNEVRQRYKSPAFASWDYTPYEARNTATKSALAHRVFTGEELLPLHPYIFTGLGITTTPDYILPTEKKNDMIKMWEGKPQGAARISGNFYSSSPVVLKNYDPQLHTLPITFKELRKLYDQPLILFRGVDPGWGHPTACSWMALAPDNTRYIYRIYSESQKSIEERCLEIIQASGNTRVPHPKSPQMWKEHVENPENQIRCTWIDYHTFKTDENTKRAFALNYINQGLAVRPSITFGPKERASQLNDLLQPQLHLPHPLNKKPPGAKIYFLINEPGVAVALQKMQNIFWETFEKGEKRGEIKDAIQDLHDDELDSVTYVSLPPLTYNSFKQQPNKGRYLIVPDNDNEESSILFSNLRLK